jgi:hypothetical protein
MERSEGHYLIRDEWRSHWNKSEGLGTNLRNSETVCKVCEALGDEGQSQSDWNNRLRRLGGYPQ